MRLLDLKQELEADGGEDNISLVLPRVPKGERIRFYPRSGPYGHVLSFEREPRPRTVAMFSKRALLAWIRKETERRKNATERRKNAAKKNV